MKKLTILALLFLSSCSFCEQLSIDNLSEGVVTKYDSLLIPDNAVSDAQNVLFDDVSIAQKRKGMIKLNSTQIGSSDDRNIYGQYEYLKSNGVRYHIAQSSNTLYYRTSGDTFTAFTSTISKTYPCNYAVFMDTLQFCNGTNNLSYWTGSSSGTTTTSYQPRYIIAWSNRLWIAGDSDEYSKVRSSEWLDPTNWTIPTSNALSSDPIVFDINSQDGQKVTGFFISPNGSLGVLKERSAWEIYGNDRDDYCLRLINNDIGCSSEGSIAYRDGYTYWLSNKGFIEYDGNSVKIISDNIENIIDNTLQLNSGSGGISKDNLSEWSTYTSTSYIDTSSLAGNISLKNRLPLYSNAINIDFIIASSSFVYAVYTSTNGLCISTVTASGVVGTTVIEDNTADVDFYQNHTIAKDSSDNLHILYVKDYNLYYAKASPPYTTWVKTKIVDSIIMSITHSYSIAIDSSGNPHVTYLKFVGSYIMPCYVYHNGASWQPMQILTNTTGRDYYELAMVMHTNNTMRMIVKRAGVQYYATRPTGTGIFWTATTLSSNYTDLVIDSAGNPHYVSSGFAKINSADVVYNIFTSGTETKVTRSGVTYTINPIGGNDFKNNQILIDGTSSYALSWSDTSTNYVFSTSSGSYISEIYNMNSNDYIFDTFQPTEAKNDYNIEHFIRGNDVESCVSTQTWTAMSSGEIISLTPVKYIQYKCVISTDVPSTNVGIVDRILINYHTGGSILRLSSISYDGRIWNAISKNDPSTLDYKLIYDSNNRWTIFTSSVSCISLLNYAGTPYMGDNNGYIYQLDQTNSDDGKAIDAYFVTKSYPLGSIITYKNINKLFLIADYAGDWNLNFSYYLDRLNTPNESFTIDLDQTAGIINYKIPLLKNTPLTTIKFKISNTNADEPFDFFGITMLYQYQPTR